MYRVMPNQSFETNLVGSDCTACHLLLLMYMTNMAFSILGQAEDRDLVGQYGTEISKRLICSQSITVGNSAVIVSCQRSHTRGAMPWLCGVMPQEAVSICRSPTRHQNVDVHEREVLTCRLFR